jgi:PTH1 family peptidyl-tRNA hydrolase
LFFFRPKRKSVDVIVVGLGNPGPKYARSRHNLGFAVLNRIAAEWTGESSWRQASDYVHLDGKHEGKSFLFLKPTTYMNLSGNAVRKAGRKWDISPDKLIVIHDDLDVAYGKVKFKFGGSPAGHKGVISIAGRLGTVDFYRLKMGIALEGAKDTVNYVLEQLDDDEWAEFDPAIDVACKGFDVFMKQGPDDAVQYVNTHGKRIGEREASERMEDG